VTTTVHTVTGPVDASELGRTLVHEHLLVGFPGWHLDALAPKFDRDAAFARAVDMLKRLRGDHGVETFLDPCPMDLGRDVRFMADVADASGMRIICTTGVYFEEQGLTYTFRNLPFEDMVAIFVKEITEGVGDSGIKAGAIKCATGAPHISDYERRMLTAAAQASLATGVPIITHTQDGCCGPEQLEIFTGEGVPAHRCLIGHSDGNADHAYHRRIVDGGAYIGFDRLGIEAMQPDATRVECIAKLVDAGFTDRVCLSHDSTCGGWLGRPVFGPGLVIDPTIMLERATKTWNPTHLFLRIMPMLHEAGVDEKAVSTMLDENPTRWFEGDTPPSAM
jgi:phosphotriesterase-related protein